MVLSEQVSRKMADGLCCSQIIVALGLELYGEDNPSMLAASFGLCHGLNSWRICGLLSSAALIFSLFDNHKAKQHMIPEFFEWYGDNYTKEFGGEDCLDITAGSPQKELCGRLVSETWEQIVIILTKHGCLKS